MLLCATEGRLSVDFWCVVVELELELVLEIRGDPSCIACPFAEQQSRVMREIVRKACWELDYKVGTIA